MRPDVEHPPSRMRRVQSNHGGRLGGTGVSTVCGNVWMGEVSVVSGYGLDSIVDREDKIAVCNVQP